MSLSLCLCVSKHPAAAARGPAGPPPRPPPRAPGKGVCPRRESDGGGKVLTDGEAVAIDAESGAPAFFEALFPAAGVRHGSAGGARGLPRQSAQPRARRPRPAASLPAARRAMPRRSAAAS